MAETDSEYDKEKLQERIAKLAGGVAVIKVGAATETELKDRKLKLEDALSATKAAVDEGIVPGGGTTLIHLNKKVSEIKGSLAADEQLAAEIIASALESPCNKLLVMPVQKAPWWWTRCVTPTSLLGITP